MSEADPRLGENEPQPEFFSRLVIGPPAEPTEEGVRPVADPSEPAETPTRLVDDGVVSWFSDEEGWGAVRTDAGHDVFAHFSVIDAPGYRTLTAGQRVHLEYESVEDQDGYQWVAKVIRET